MTLNVSAASKTSLSCCPSLSPGFHRLLLLDDNFDAG